MGIILRGSHSFWASWAFNPTHFFASPDLKQNSLLWYGHKIVPFSVEVARIKKLKNVGGELNNVSFNLIVDPNTGKKISIFSKKGKKILKNYVNFYRNGL